MCSFEIAPQSLKEFIKTLIRLLKLKLSTICFTVNKTGIQDQSFSIYPWIEIQFWLSMFIISSIVNVTYETFAQASFNVAKTWLWMQSTIS